MRLRNEYYPRFRTFSSTTDFCISGIGNLSLLKAITLGAEAGINYKTEDFAARVSELTEGRGANVILDCVGGSYVQQNMEALAIDGRYHRPKYTVAKICETYHVDGRYHRPKYTVAKICETYIMLMAGITD